MDYEMVLRLVRECMCGCVCVGVCVCACVGGCVCDVQGVKECLFVCSW